MVYHAASLNPTAEQAHMLAHGARVIFKPHQIGCGHEVYLTATQAARIAKSHRAGKSAHLRLSEAQLRHHRTHGSGFFSDLVRKVKGAARSAYSVAQPLLASSVGQALQAKAVDAAGSFAKRKLGLQQGEGIFDDIMGGIGQVAKIAAPFAVPLMQRAMGGCVPIVRPQPQRGFGVRASHRRAAHHQGEGIFDDIMGGIRTVAQTVAPIALPLAQTLIQRRMGGSVQKRAPRGAGLWA